MNQEKSIFNKLYVFMVLLLCISISLNVDAKGADKKALKLYKTFLEKNVSSFKEIEGDFYTQNKETADKCTSFMVLDMDRNGTPELITYHPKGYKQGYLNVYMYKKGKVVRVKKKNKKVAKISEDCNAAGWYNTYSCTQGHLHVRWEGGWIGFNETVYNMQNGKLNTYLYSSIDNLVEKEIYKINGKKVSSDDYYLAIEDCRLSKGRKMRRNTKGNQSKYVK